MKNRTIYKYLFILTLTALVSSCDLERKPKGEMDADSSLVKVEDVLNWQAGMMSRIRYVQGRLFNMVSDIQADQLSATVADGNHYPASRTWGSATSTDYDRRDVYNVHYLGIKNINYVIMMMESFNIETDAQKAIYNKAMGVAHFARAYHYSNLALYYGTPYKAATAATDLCVPMPLKYNATEKRKRSTNEEVYKQILDIDLVKAKEYLAGMAGKPMADEITIDAVTALEARTRLYMSDWAGAYNAASSLINSGIYPLVAPTQENFVNMWVNDASTEEILQMFSERPDEVVGIQYYFGPKADKKRQDGSNGVNSPSHIPTQWMLDLYQDTDLRKGVYFEKQQCNFDDVFVDLYLVSKRKGSPALSETQNPAFTFWNGYVPNGQHNPKVFRIAEQYLIAAEAAYHLGKDATTPLNALRKSRGLEPVTATGEALLKAIKDERTRELAYEGFRLWDLRRWGQPMKRYAPQSNNGSLDFLKKTDAVNVEFPATDYRFVWPIPYNDVVTAGVKQNPGW